LRAPPGSFNCSVQLITNPPSIIIAYSDRVDTRRQTRLAELLPHGVAVTILANRGFGDTKLFGFLDTLGFDYVIRLSRCI
jgi:hypothetical protein